MVAVVVALSLWLAAPSGASASGWVIQPSGGLSAPFAHAAAAAAAAEAPTAHTDPTVTLDESGQRLQGTGTTGGLDTRTYFQYALSSDPFCSSGGTSGTPVSTSPVVYLAGFTPFVWDTYVAGLSGGSTYCFRFVAANSAGTSYGAIYDFVAVSTPPPGVSVVSVTTTGSTTAIVDGTVSPFGLATTYQVDYDAVGSPYCTSHGQGNAAFVTASATIPVPPPPLVDPFQNVSVRLSGLSPGKQYCAAITASNSSGQGLGWGGTFTAGVPLTGLTTVTAVGQRSATVEGSVDPVGQTTRFYAVFDTAGSTWCRSGGAAGTPSFSGAQQTLPFTNAADHDVSAPVAGLAPDTSYCIGLAARNGSGTTLAASPAALPAMPRLTLSFGSPFMLPPGRGSVRSSPAGIACPQACSAGLPRGTSVTLRAGADAGSAFAGWDPRGICGGSHCGSGPPGPCAGSTSVTCTFILSDDTVVSAIFTKHEPPSCSVGANRTVRRHAVLVSVSCTDAVYVNLAGTLTERSAHGSVSKVALRPLHPRGARSAWQLSYKLPAAAARLLAAGWREAITLKLEYTNSAGSGRATVTIRTLAR